MSAGEEQLWFFASLVLLIFVFIYISLFPFITY